MANAELGAALRHIRGLVAPRSTEQMTDRQLLDGFLARRDDAAFAALVKRHGPLVLAVCRRVLHHQQDAEDAFQATFLVLACKAASMRKGEALANWLHGVAYRTALKARRDAARRQVHEGKVSAMRHRSALPDPSWPEVQAILDEEVQRLPARYRAVFVLCCLQDKSRAEAGRELSLKEGTVRSRLSQARARLQQRLARRGVALSAVLTTAALSQDAGRAALTARLVNTTVEAALLFAGDKAGAAGTISLKVATLAKGMTKAMSMTKLRITVLFLLAIGAAGGAGVLTHRALAGLQAGAGAGSQTFPMPAAEPAGPGQPQAPPSPPGDAAAIDHLIQQLGAEQFTAREAASKALAAIGEPAYDALRKAAATSKDVEIRRRAEELAQIVEQHWEVRRFEGHTREVDIVAFSPDGRRALSSSDDRTVRLWDVETGKEVRRFEGHTERVFTVACSPDGRRALSGSVDGTVRLWDLETGKQLLGLMGHTGNVVSVAFSPDGRRALSAGKDLTLRLWDLDTGKEVRVFRGHTDEVWSVVFSPDGRRALSSGQDKTVRLWDVETGRELRCFTGHTAAVDNAVLSADGRRALSSSGDKSVRLWDVETGRELRRFPHPAGVVSVAVSPDGRWAVSGAQDGVVRLWDVETGQELRRFQGHTALVFSVAFSPDGRRALSGSEDKTLRLWDLPKEKR